MTAHELARKLLELPDHEVMVYDDEMQFFRGVRGPDVGLVDSEAYPFDPDNPSRPPGEGSPIVALRGEG